MTHSTYVLAVFPPGEAELQCAQLNILQAGDEFARIESAIAGDDEDIKGKRKEDVNNNLQ